MNRIKKFIVYALLCMTVLIACPNTPVNPPKEEDEKPVGPKKFYSLPVLAIIQGDQNLTYTWESASPEADSYDLYWIEGEFYEPSDIKAEGTQIPDASSGGVISRLTNGKTYSFVVTAYKEGYITSDSKIQYGVPLFDNTIDYTGPGNITIADNKISITWDSVSEADRYRISRAGSRLGEYEFVDYVSDGDTFIDENPNPNKYENYYKVAAMKNDQVLSEKLIAFEIKVFGEDSYFYDSKYDKISDITDEVNTIHDTITKNGHWTNRRFALYFKPGTYTYTGSMRVGFYTSVHGLGAIPPDTKLLGTVECPALLGGNNVTQNFWRSIENLSIESGRFRWSVSQAAPARRMKATVETVFDWDGGWASGGFVSDSHFTAKVGSGSQQQFYARNCLFESVALSGINWNKTVQGSSGKVEDSNTTASRTKIDTTPVIREKPFLYFDSTINEYMVFVPAFKEDAVGISWSDDSIGDGQSLVLIKEFYIAKPGVDTADTINTALDSGKHLFFTPGRYELSTPIHVKNAGTVVLGSGFATLIPANGNKFGAIFVDDVPGVTVASLMFDALYDSTYLLCVGESNSTNDHSDNPTLLADIFLRVGGVRSNCNADISALVNSNNVIGDHFWAWRADHGSGVGWTSNKTKNGVVVTGDDVTFYGLFVEHYHEYETLWLGENGRTYFYQNEAPYDPPNQSSYRSHNNTVNGWAAYKVANHVNKHYAVGMGSYSVFRNNVFRQNPYEVPNKPGVIIQNACTHRLASGGYGSIVNGAGQGNPPNSRQYILFYEDGVAECSGPTEGTQPPDEEFNIPADLHPASVN